MQKIQLTSAAIPFYTWESFKSSGQSILLCCYDEEKALAAYQQLVFLSGDLQGSYIMHFPSYDTIPYDRVSPSCEIMSKRASTLTKIAKDSTPKIIVTAAQNLAYKLPCPDVFLKANLEIKTGDKITIHELSSFLVINSFSRVASAVENSEFAVRGEIIDIVNSNNVGYRINFSWDQIDSIRQFDPYSQISTQKLDKISISPASEIVLNAETITIFKSNFLQLFGVNYINSPLYESIIAGKKFHGYEHLTPLFYQEMVLFFDFLPEDSVTIHDNLCLQAILEQENSYLDFYQSRLESNKLRAESFYFAIPPSYCIANSSEVKDRLSQENNILIEPGENKGFSTIVNIASQAKLEQKTEFTKLFEIMEENKGKIFFIFCKSIASREKISAIIKDYNYKAKPVTYLEEHQSAHDGNFVNFTITPLDSSFSSKHYLFISENDIWGNKFASQSNISSRKKLKNILTELDNIVEGELVVHMQHGIGRFEQIQTICVNNIPHDFLKIIYADNDIFYLPVENIEQLKKFGSEDTPLDKLGAASWQNRKARLKNKIKDIAEKLIQLSAQRQITKARPICFEQNTYDDFCQKFPYSETKDQLTAIEEIKADLESGKLMDRLICGDVGFGKTEVAMRAALMVACDINEIKPQIVLISPTTILCKQHYKNFLERFKGLQLKIVQLSRLVSSAEARKVKIAIESGEADIIIGTHALLAPTIKFNNLKMIIIDEEQHFGVTQKEHLKQLKTNIHILSLSATPIPRTMQMSMIGIKDLSLIASPPIDRLPIRTSILPYDGVVIREALMRERFRGGLSFYVVPRIKDIEQVTQRLDQIVPELKYKIAHGQMAASHIDNIMNEFCEGKFDILLSTTIIESGIDIPIANTLIIHRAEMLGLSQLYQLRGRVGRGKVRGYAYLTLGNSKITKHSVQRLEILQNIESLGAGFTIASHDMDLRGFGNLVGDEQSGHIKEVGAELYHQMLDEAIKSLQTSGISKTADSDYTPSINLPIPILIPAGYIEDSSLRLAIYRRAGDLKTMEEVENFRLEMIDRFGTIPLEFENLLQMVCIKNKCLELKIESLDSGTNGFVIKFNANFDVSDMVLNFVQKYPRNSQIKPTNKLVFIKPLAKANLINETEKLLQEFSNF